MTADFVWLSTAMKDPSQIRPFTNDLTDNDGTGYLTVDTNKRNNAGEPLGPEAFPKVIWGCAERGAKTFGKLPDLFIGYGYWVVSERCADVLRQFDLGQGALYPVKVMQKDKVTPIGDHAWFCINFGNTKRAFVREASDPNGFGSDIGGKASPWSFIKDEQCAVSTSALSGPDIWIDPTIDEGLFVSGALGNALRKAKCASGWGLRRCRMIAS